MKQLATLTVVLMTALGAAEPIWAQDATTSRTTTPEAAAPTGLGDLDMHINPQIGLSSFEYSGHTEGGKQGYTGGSTIDFGGSERMLETGILFMQTNAQALMSDGTTQQINMTYLTVPMMAKLRVVSLGAQSWYIKFGALTAVQVGSSDRNVTTPADLMASMGVSGRFLVSKKTDFIVDATYNRGLLEAVQTAAGASYNQGILVLAGFSFRL